MSNLKTIKTLELIKMLDEECEIDYSSEKIYLYIKEIAIRQAHRQAWYLSPSQVNELVDTVATNMYMYLQNRKGYRASNWLMWIYNTVYRTSIGMFPNGQDVKTQIFEVHDMEEEQEFLTRYFYNQIHQYTELDEIECQDYVDNLYKQLHECIVFFIKYNESYELYNTIIYSVLLSVILEKQVHLYGLNRSDCQYVDVLSDIVLNNFKKYLLMNWETASHHNDCVLKLVDYLQYERMQEIYDKR